MKTDSGRYVFKPMMPIFHHNRKSKERLVSARVPYQVFDDVMLKGWG